MVKANYALALVWAIVTMGSPALSAAERPDPIATARQVDRLLEASLTAAGAELAPTCSDEDFLRRVCLDLVGRTPTAAEVTLFGLNGNPDKRSEMIGYLLQTDDYARNWSRYWRDVIYSRATEQRSRIGLPAFETWMADQLNQNRSWDRIATDLLTATGDVRENGDTALMFAQGGEAEEIAAEASRIFLGIQLQCANCHDHPSDIWKRDQFHELAAFFPRIAVRPVREGNNTRSFEVVSFNQDRGNPLEQIKQNINVLFTRMDRDRNGRITRNEAQGSPLGRPFDRIMAIGDKNQDGGLSRDEIRNLPIPMAQAGRGSLEHYMADLNDPTARGARIDPAFFVNGATPKPGLDDQSRRELLSRYMTSPGNPWFSRAYVNRIWNELLGTAFYNPVDDIGPSREAQFPEVLEVLSTGFVASGHDIRWLFEVIAATDAYQREIRDLRLDRGDIPFAAVAPSRLRADQIYGSLLSIAGAAEQSPTRRPAYGPAAMGRDPRGGFNQIFGFDPSTPSEDILGNVPQALFMMNSSQIANLAKVDSRTRLGNLIRTYEDDDDALAELYLLVLSREPSGKERDIAKSYIEGSSTRAEAYEDLMWALLNSTEFLTNR